MSEKMAGMDLILFCVFDETPCPLFGLSRFLRSLLLERPALLRGIRNSFPTCFTQDTFLPGLSDRCRLGRSGVAHASVIEVAQCSYRLIDGHLLGFESGDYIFEVTKHQF
jgi:hypothetical protein